MATEDTTVPGIDDVTPEPTASTPWLDYIREAEKTFKDYQDIADKIDKQYADLSRLADTTRDREIQVFWANVSVMAPSTYSRPPVPVVVPRWDKDSELPRVASEMLERATVVTFEKEDVDYVMRLIRDDLVIQARGAAWLRYDTTGGTKRVCVDHADRKDFLYSAARNWKDVDWVAKRSWLAKDKTAKRFGKEKAEKLDFAIRKDSKADYESSAPQAGVWEVWCKSANKVVWVSEGCDVVLDQNAPHLTLDGFFPCPRPAFGTLMRRTLVPVPDMVFYKDQLEEINEITARIAALTEAVRVRGFYPAGAGEIGAAIEAAMKSTSNNTVLVPIANWAMVGTGGVKDMIVWVPLEMISATITAIIQVRKQLMEDVYEVTGLSDIMRGQTEASETLGAQQLKSQYGSVRIRDRQDELVRVARDITRMSAEIMAENFDGATLMEMAQMPLPTTREVEEKAAPLAAELKQIQVQLPAIQKQLQGLQQEIQGAQADPEVQQMAQANPDQAKQVLGQVQAHAQQLQAQAQQMQQQAPQLQQQLKALSETVTIDKVMKLLQEQRLRPFVLDIETESTIAPDEDAAKKRATEFVTAVGGYMQNALPLAETNSLAAPVVAQTLKFITSKYRAGRELQGTIDKFADAMKAKSEQPPPPNPEAVKAQAEAEATKQKTASDAESAKADNAAKLAAAKKDEADARATLVEAQTKAQDAEVKRKIEVQRELDASDARKADMTQKADLASVQIVLLREKHLADAEVSKAETEQKANLASVQIVQQHETHKQTLEKGILEIEAIRAKMEQAAALTASALVKDKAAVAAHEATAAAAAQKPKKEPA